VGDHAGSALDERLEDQRGDLVAVGRERVGERREAVVAAGGRCRGFGAAVPVRRWDAQGVEQERVKDLVKQVDAADGDRADGVAVVGLPQGDDAALARAAPVRPVLKRDFQRDLDGRRAAVRVEDLAEAGRGDLEQTFGELVGRNRGQAEQGRVGDAVELCADGGVARRAAGKRTLRRLSE
jgi:hypothetical protein